MTREIKFRAFSKKTGKFLICNVGVYFRNGKLWGFVPGGRDDEPDWWLNPNEFVFVEFTGLRDKNGKEIYEGDVVRIVEHWREREVGKIEVVTYDSGIFGPFGDNELSADPDKAEVIGNIHETPELVK